MRERIDDHERSGPSNKNLLPTREHRCHAKRSMISSCLVSVPFVLWTSLSVRRRAQADACIPVTQMWRTAGKGSEQKLESENVCGVGENCGIISLKKTIVLCLYSFYSSQLYSTSKHTCEGKCSSNSMKCTFIKKSKILKNPTFPLTNIY